MGMLNHVQNKTAAIRAVIRAIFMNLIRRTTVDANGWFNCRRSYRNHCRCRRRQPGRRAVGASYGIGPKALEVVDAVSHIDTIELAVAVGIGGRIEHAVGWTVAFKRRRSS